MTNERKHSAVRRRHGNVRTATQRNRTLSHSNERAIRLKQRTRNALLFFNTSTIIVGGVCRRRRARCHRRIVRHRRACNGFPLERLAHRNVVRVAADTRLNALHAKFIAVVDIRWKRLREENRRANFLSGVVAAEL